MPKAFYLQIGSNFSGLTQERQNALKQYWAKIRVDIVLDVIKKPPVKIQEPVYIQIKREFE